MDVVSEISWQWMKRLVTQTSAKQSSCMIVVCTYPFNCWEMVYFISSQTYLLICECRWHAASATLMSLALSKKSHYNAAAWRHNCVAPLSTLIGRLLARNNAPTQWRHVAAAAVVRLIASVTSPRGVKWRREGAHVNRRWINKDCSARMSRVDHRAAGELESIAMLVNLLSWRRFSVLVYDLARLRH